MMPEGLFDKLSEQEIRDLVAYLGEQDASASVGISLKALSSPIESNERSHGLATAVSRPWPSITLCVLSTSR